MSGIFESIDPALLGEQGGGEGAAPSSASQELVSGASSGLRSAGLGALGQLNTLAGVAGQDLGFDEFGARRRARGRELSREAAEAAPRVGRLGDIHSLRDLANFTGGVAGGSVPVAGAALGAGLLTDGAAIPAMLAGTGAVAPLEVGDVLQRQEAQGQEPSLRTAALPGLASAAVQNIVPGLSRAAMAGKVAAKGLAGAAATIPEQAVAAGGGEAIKEAGSGQAINPEDIGQAAATGAFGALPFAAMHAAGGAGGAVKRAAGTVGDLAKTGLDQARTKLGGAADAARTAGEQVAEKAAPIGDGIAGNLKNLFDQGKLTAQAGLDAVAGNEDFMNAKRFVGAQGDKLKDLIDADDGERLDKVKEWAGELADSALSPEKAAQLKAATSDLADRGNQAVIAGLKRGQDMLARAREKIGQFAADVGAKAAEPDEGTKQSADFSGIRKAIVDEIAPVIQKVNPDLLDDPQAVNQLADGIRGFLGKAARGDRIDSDTLARLIDIIGPGTADVVEASYRAMGNTDPAATEHVFNVLNQIVGVQKSDATLMQTLRSSLKKEYADIPDSVLRDASSYLRNWARDSGNSPEDARTKFRGSQIMEQLGQYFDKPDAVMTAVEKAQGRTKKVVDHMAGEDGFSVDEPNLIVRGHQNGGLFLHPDNDPSKFGPAAERALARAKIQAPESEHRIATSHELGMDHPLVGKQHARLVKQATDAGLSEEQAHRYADQEIGKYAAVVTERDRNETAVSHDELQGMKLDTHRHAASASRIDAGTDVDGKPLVLDAQRVIRTMAAKVGEASAANESKAQWARRVFMEGIAAVQDRTGHGFDVPDATRIFKDADTGKTWTWGELQHLDVRTTEDKRNDAQAKDIEAARGSYREARTPAEKARVAEEGKRMVAAREDAKARDLTRGEETPQPDEELAASGRTERDPFGPTHDALQGREEGAPIHTDSGEARGGLTSGRKSAAREAAPAAARSEPAVLKERARERGTVEDKAADVAALDKSFATEKYPDFKSRAEVDKFLTDGKRRYAQLKAERERVTNDDNHPTNELPPLQDKAFKTLAELFGEGSHADLESFYEGVPPSPKEVAAKQAAFTEKARSGDPELTKALKASTDAKGLQRAVEHLASLKDPKVQATIDVINDRLGELVRSNPDVGYGMQLRGHYSLEQTNSAHTSTSAVWAAAEDDIRRRLGDSVLTTTKVSIPHAGEFMKAAQGGGLKDIIRMSVHALDPRSVAAHESFHAFFHQLAQSGQSEIMKVLTKAGESASVMDQLRRLLKNEPEALKQLSDAEERAAYMFQFWSQGKLKVGGEPHGVLDAIRKFVQRVLGVWSNDQRALHILEYFESGKYESDRSDPNAVFRATMDGGRNATLTALGRATEPFRHVAETIGVAGGQRLRDTGVPALQELADKMKLGTTATGSDTGYIPAARGERSRVMNELSRKMAGMDQATTQAALEALQTKTNDAINALSDPAQRVAARNARTTIRQTLDGLFSYMRGAGVDVHDLGVGKDYFPRVWSPDAVSRDQAGFLKMLEPYVQAGLYKGDPRKLMLRLIASEGNEFTVERLNPGMQYLKPRELEFISAADAARFSEKNLWQIMNSYVTQATRRAEWARRFGDQGEEIGTLLEQAKAQGATEAQLDTARKFTMAVDGTLGDTINPTARRLMGNMIVYQNLRLLPLAIFSSVVDPLGIVVRGGTVGDAFSAFKRGIVETRKNFQKSPTHDGATELAALLGTIDDASLVHTLGASYSQGMVGDTGRKINDTFFRYNLMEQFNTSMRVAATEAALKFLARQKAGGVHADRYLAELGLDASDIQTGPDGRTKVSEADGLTAEHAARMKAAVNRWVDGAVLRPDAADKPIWFSDPHFALISHLKQFVYAFHETILKRVMHEFEHGNYKPGMALASYVPIMIAADLAKGLIQGGGQQPEWKQKWTAGDYVWSGVERAGLLGTGQFAADAVTDINRGGSGLGMALGPTVEQTIEAIKTLDGHEQFKTAALHAMPANALYASAFHAPSTDPNFAD